MIEIVRHDRVAVLTMTHGKANALDVELCRALRNALDASAAPSTDAVVLTGTGSIFSAGVDLHRVVAGGKPYLADYLPELRRLFTRLAHFELPLVAAVNGHAIAGGCILLAAADRAVMAEGRGRVGVTELLVGVPFPAIAFELLRLRAGDAQLAGLVLDAPTFEPEQALARGLIDAVVPAEDLLANSLEVARRLAALGPAFGIAKRQLRLPLEERVRSGAALEDEVDEVWGAPRTLERIRTYMAAIARRDGADPRADS